MKENDKNTKIETYKMGRKSMAGKTLRTCTVGAKLQKYIISSNFSLKLLLTVI